MTTKKKLKIGAAIGISLIITIMLRNTVFPFNSPKPNTFFLSTVPEKLGSFFSSLSPKPTPTPSVTALITSYPLPTAAVQTPQPTKKPIVSLMSKPTPKQILPSPTPSPTPKLTSCPTTSSQTYQTVRTNSDYTLNEPAETHPEINLALRGYVEVNEQLGLVHYGGDTDPLALKINSIFADGRKPTVVKTFKVYAWDYANHRRSTETENAWPVSLIGLGATLGESLVVPPSGRNISGDFVLMVLYANESRITFTNSVGDNWTDGYILHVEDICTDPNLIAAYQNANAGGRGSLPALPKGQVFGTARNGEPKVAIRDSGQFMDPRSDKDWW